MENRDDFLQMDDETLSLHCKLEFFKGSGNGGQKRNKTSSAVRVRLTGTAFSAEDCSGRSQHRNRSAALYKLRLAVAYACRRTPATPPERAECAVGHPEYPRNLAHLLDLCEEKQWDLKTVAGAIGKSPSALVKLLARDPELWQHANARRLDCGLPALRR